MTVFDTDVATEILLGNPLFVQRASAIPLVEQAVPIVVVEEITRGRLNVIRQAEAGKPKSASNAPTNFCNRSPCFLGLM